MTAFPNGNGWNTPLLCASGALNAHTPSGAIVTRKDKDIDNIKTRKLILASALGEEGITVVGKDS